MLATVVGAAIEPKDADTNVAVPPLLGVLSVLGAESPPPPHPLNNDEAANPVIGNMGAPARNFRASRREVFVAFVMVMQSVLVEWLRTIGRPHDKFMNDLCQQGFTKRLTVMGCPSYANICSRHVCFL